MRRVDLVRKGYEELETASKSISIGDFREAELRIEMANAFARLGDALDAASFTERSRRTTPNW